MSRDHMLGRLNKHDSPINLLGAPDSTNERDSNGTLSASISMKLRHATFAQAVAVRWIFCALESHDGNLHSYSTFVIAPPPTEPHRFLWYRQILKILGVTLVINAFLFISTFHVKR